jgi:hypothetical protein
LPDTIPGHLQVSAPWRRFRALTQPAPPLRGSMPLTQTSRRLLEFH